MRTVIWHKLACFKVHGDGFSSPSKGGVVVKNNLNSYRGELTPNEIVLGMNCAISNAKRLAEDARLLFDSGRFPTACSIAILSIEELGKVSILRHFSLCRNKNEMSRIWKEYRSHTCKNYMVFFLDIVAKGARKLDDFKEIFTSKDHALLANNLKQIGLYSDCLGEKNWSNPNDIIDEQLARSLVQTAELLAVSKKIVVREIELWIEHMKPMWNGPAGSREKALENWYAAMQNEGLARPGTNEMAQFIRERILMPVSAATAMEPIQGRLNGATPWPP